MPRKTDLGRLEGGGDPDASMRPRPDAAENVPGGALAVDVDGLQ